MSKHYHNFSSCQLAIKSLEWHGWTCYIVAMRALWTVMLAIGTIGLLTLMAIDRATPAPRWRAISGSHGHAALNNGCFYVNCGPASGRRSIWKRGGANGSGFAKSMR